jgi:hypothetical protein
MSDTNVLERPALLTMPRRDLNVNSPEKISSVTGHHYDIHRNDRLRNGLKKLLIKKRAACLPSQEFVEDCHLAAFWQLLERRFYRYRGLILFFILINLFFWGDDLLLVDRCLVM